MKWMLVVMNLLGSDPGVVSNQEFDSKASCEVEQARVAKALSDATPGMAACLGWVEKASSMRHFGKQT